MSTRFHVGNCAPQCYACNVGMSGMQYEYGKRLDLKYGTGMADDMVAQSRIIRKFTPDELLEKIQETESAVNFLRQSKNIWD
jgi:ATP-dependent phosphoenolpyruvate carboxykinase